MNRRTIRRIRNFVLVMIILVIVLLAGIMIGLNLKTTKTRPVFVAAADREWSFEIGQEAGIINGNFWAFAKKSYILIGTPPDCQFYKIVSNVERNDYITNFFYRDEENDYMYYHDSEGNKTTKLAIDVSAYQPDVDWEQVKQAGIDMAIIRAGYRGYGNGALAKDDMFTSHINGALNAGLEVGVYFFTQALNTEEGIEEAEFVLDAISSYDVTGPVVCDTELIEVEDARTENQDIISRTDAVVAFCDTIKAAGYRSFVYANRNWFAQSLDMSRLSEHEIWFAQYADKPDFPYLYKLWQYTDGANVPGIDKPVDLSVYFE